MEGLILRTYFFKMRILLAFILLFLAGTFVAQGQPKKAVADKIVAVVGDRIYSLFRH